MSFETKEIYMHQNLLALTVQHLVFDLRGCVRLCWETESWGLNWGDRGWNVVCTGAHENGVCMLDGQLGSCHCDGRRGGRDWEVDEGGNACWALLSPPLSHAPIKQTLPISMPPHTPVL
jgi:hypothetical protein